MNVRKFFRSLLPGIFIFGFHIDTGSATAMAKAGATFSIIAAGVSSQFPNVMLLPWLLCDYSGQAIDMTLPRYRIMVGILSLLGLVVPIFNARPVAVMIVSQAFGSLLLPVTVLSTLILGNKRTVMGDDRHSVIENMILLSIFVFSLVMSFYGLRGLWWTLSTLLS